MKEQRRRFWIESGLAVLSGFVLLLTLVWQDWIEKILRVDPDHHDGSLEWLMVGVSLVSAVAFSVLARLEWRKRSALST